MDGEYIYEYACPGELIITRKQIINKPLDAQKSAIKNFWERDGEVVRR